MLSNLFSFGMEFLYIFYFSIAQNCPCLRSCVCCLGTLSTFSQVQDAVRIFFAVFFWMSLFFWSCIWDGNNSGRPGKGPRIRRWDNRYLLHILCRVRNKGYLVPLISFVINEENIMGSSCCLYIHIHSLLSVDRKCIYMFSAESFIFKNKLYLCWKVRE